MSEAIKPFLCTNVDISTVRCEWERWFRSFTLYLQSEDINDPKKKKNKLLHLAGPQLQDVIFNIPGAVTDTGKDQYKILVDKLNDYFVPARNSTFERHLFRAITAEEGEDINKFLLRLRNQASKCKFGQTENEIIENSLKDKIIDSWASAEVRKKLLEKELSLKEVVELCQLHEHMNNQLVKMQRQPVMDVNKVVVKRNNKFDNFEECSRCGRKSHKANDECCPARQARCNNCNLIGHFAKKCRTQARKRKFNEPRFQGPKHSKIRRIEENENESDERESHINVDCLRVSDESGKDGVLQCVIGGCSVKMIIDSGSRFNLLGENDWNALNSAKATMWNLRVSSGNRFKAYASNQPLKVIQIFESTIAVGGKDMFGTFYVVKDAHQSLLGRDTAIQLGVLKLGIGVNKIEEIKPFAKIKNLKVTLSIDISVKPVQQPLRRIPIAFEKKVEHKLEEALALDIIEKVKGPSPWISPIVTVFKDDGEMRMCVDMRQANKAVLRENYPLPTFDIFMTRLRSAKIFSRLDLKWAYHQVELETQSRYITTFITHKGLYRYKRLMFGISSAPEIFQRIMENLLASCRNVLNYIDDIIVYGDSVSTHDEALKEVLQTLQNNNIQLNESKCLWRVKELKFLGHILSDKGITPDPGKIQTILNFRAPISKEELRSFLGLVTYVGKFIQNLATVTEPLRRLTKSDVKFVWGHQEQKSFESLKKQLVELPTLSFFKQELRTRVVADASPVALGAVLLQFDGKGEPRIITFAHRSLSTVEKKYSQTEKEGLALVWAVERFHYYLAGRIFELVTDHQPLEAIFKPTSRPPARIERWMLRLQSFKFKVIYKSGKENIADPLSRLCEINVGEQGDVCQDQGVFYIIKAVIPSSVSIQEVLSTSAQDKEIVDAIQFLQNDDWSQDRGNCFYPFRYELTSVASILLRGTRLVIPQKLRSRVLELAHEGHPGESAMKRRIRAKVWWPRVDYDVIQFVKSCKNCLMVSKPDNPPPMKRTLFPNGPWQCVATDLLGPLPNNEYIFVLIDYYSRYQELKFIKKITSEIIISILKEIFSRLGIPMSLRADNGKQYVSMEFKSFCKTNNINLISTPPYWPQANGEVENMNKSLVKRLKIAHANQKNYVEEIRNFIMMYNATPHSVTGSIPAELMFGRPIRDKIPDINDITAETWDSAARDSDLINKHKGKIHADKVRGAKESGIMVGDKVLLRNVVLSNKLTTPFDVKEYTVMSRKGDEVIVTDGVKTYRRHVSHVKKCIGEQPQSEQRTAEENIASSLEDQPRAKRLAQGHDDCERPELTIRLQRKEGMWQSAD